MHSLKLAKYLSVVSILVCMVSCVDTESLESKICNLEDRISAMEDVVGAVNANSVAIHAMYAEGIAVLDVSFVENGCSIVLSDGTVINVVDGIGAAAPVPLIGLDEDGNWIVSTDGGETFEPIEGAANALFSPEAPLIRVSADGYWEYSVDGGETWSFITGNEGRPVSAVDGKEVVGRTSFFTEIVYAEGDDCIRFTLADGRIFSVPVDKDFILEVVGHEDRCVICLSETITYALRSKGVSDMVLTVPEGWSARCTEDEMEVTAPSAGEAGEYHVNVMAVSSEGRLRNVTLVFTLKPVMYDPIACPEWNDFIAGNSRNVLPDFSFAGYSHGEAAPPVAESLGYRKYDVTDYGAVPDDGKSDRDAFLAALKDALKVDYETGPDGTVTFAHKPAADAIVCFPEGEFILHTAEDDTDGKSAPVIIRSGNFIIKGAGMDKTTLVMQDPMLPEDESVLYSSPDMIQIKHNTGISSFKVPAAVTEDAPKGTFAVTVSSTASLKEGDWVCLHMKNADPELVASEVSPYQAESGWAISSDGVEVIDYHQIRSVEGNVVTFVEPLMHAVEAKWGWEIKEYPHYENVGVEDLAFKGNAKSDFEHHGSWEDDGAYKPLSLNRLVNSWIRNVAFERVSEACSVINSANVSAYNIVMTGDRGHSAVRSQASSRVLIAATSDETSEGTGNFHGVGVSRNSIGTVLWRNRWGDDSCFEAHSTQPRATLVDCCEGGWMRGHQGGDAVQAPNHLDDLVIWNFRATGAGSAGTSDYADFMWWESTWWKFLPPVIVGFRSDVEVNFNAGQTKVISSPGVQVSPESLYEAQLRHRLGALPAWLEMLK